MGDFKACLRKANCFMCNRSEVADINGVTISKEQQGLETVRQVLSHQERFCPYTSFKRVKSADTSFISKDDIVEFLKFFLS